MHRSVGRRNHKIHCRDLCGGQIHVLQWIDARIVNLTECYALRSELWSAVRVHLEAPVAGSNDWRALPSCFAHFFELSQPGTIVRLRDAGAAEAANLSIAALGGQWSGPGPLNLEW